MEGAHNAPSDFSQPQLAGLALGKAGLTLHGAPRLQTGLRHDELRGRLWQDVVAKYLLVWRWRRRCAHRGEEHRSAFFVLRPNWCRVVEILEAGRDLNAREIREGEMFSAPLVNMGRIFIEHPYQTLDQR